MPCSADLKTFIISHFHLLNNTSTPSCLPPALRAYLGTCETNPNPSRWENMHTMLMSYSLWILVIATPKPVALGRQTTCFHNVLHIKYRYKENKKKIKVGFFWTAWNCPNCPIYYETRARFFKNLSLLTITMWATTFVAVHEQGMEELQEEKIFPIDRLLPQVVCVS